MFEKAKAFIAEAQKNIYKSANLQHSISSTLKNLLMLREFQSLKDYFEEGNWLRIETDGEINRLRLMSYEVDYENTNDLSVEFSDVSKLKDGISDIQSVLDNSKSIASSFNAVTRQAKNGNDSRKTIDKWINSGIALNNIKIIQDAENQNVIFDNNGILCREYLPMIDSYDERQLKIINKGLFLTDDNWQSAKVGIGEIEYNGEKSYGVNAQLLIGDIIIGNELHIKDSQGHDILTVIDGRISTEVSEVKSAAASGTFEYYDPSNLSWTEQNNVDYFGYGLSQDEAETDTGIKAAGNNNKYFLNKHNGNLYKSNGIKWVFQKTLSPRFNNYSTIAYTDNKASTAESNAITNATNQVSTAKAIIASSTLKYDETGITVNYYGYGAPTEIAGATQGKIYLDQNDGYYYTKGSGSNWTKSSSALPLYADQKANVAKSEAISVASADAAQKANQAEENAIADATNQVNNATTTIANATNKYDTTGLTITYFGYGVPDIATAISGQKYLDQNDGYVYTKKSGSGWTKSTSALTLITTKVATDAANDATTKANNAISTAATDATAKANTAENNAKTAAANAMSKYDEGSLTINYYGFGAPTTVAGSSQGEIYLDQNTGYYYTKGSGSTWTKSANALPLYADQKATETYNNALGYVATYYITSEDSDTKINQTKQEIETKAAKAVNKYEVPVGITVNFAGYGTPAAQGVKATAANQYYLDQETGNLYKSDSNKNWGSTPTHSLPIITDKLDSKITQTANDITLSVSQNYSTKTETSDAFDNAKTYADGKASTAESNAKTYAEGKANTAESNAKTYAEEQAGTAESNAIANTTSQVNSAKSTIAGATSKYDTSGQTITYYGYGTPDISGASSGQKYLDQDSGYVYTKGSGSTWTKSSTPLTLISTKVAQDAATDATNKASAAEDNAKTYAEGQATQAKNDAIADTVDKLKSYSTTTQMNTAITESAESIRLAASKAVSKYDITDKTVNFYAYGLSDDLTTTDTGTKATGNSGKFILNQTDGKLYKSNGSKWVYQETLTTITDKLDSKITVTAEGIRSDVSANYSTKTYAENQASTAESNAKTYAEGKANTAESNAKTYAEGKATEAENNAKSYADDLSDEMTTTINQTANAIEMKAAKAVSKYQIPNGMTIHFAGYGTPIAQGAVATEANQNYLDQETGRVYTSKANKSWDMNSYQSLRLITDNLDTKIDVTAQGITQTVSQTYSTKSETSDKAAEAEANAKSTTASGAGKYVIPTGLTITYYGYGLTNNDTKTDTGISATASDVSGKYFLNLTDGNVYQSNGIKWNKDTTVSPLKLASKQAEDNAKDYTDTQIDETVTSMNTKIDQTAEQISLEANARLEATVGYSSKNWLNLNKYTYTSGVSNVVIDEATGSLSYTGTGTNRTVSFTAADLGVEMYGKTYTVSCVNNLASTTSGRLAVRKLTTNQIVKSVSFSTTGNKSITFTPDVETFPNGWYISVLATGSTSTTGNIDISQLMLRDSSISDDTFEPFANVQSVTTNLQSQITQNANQIQLKVSAGDVCSVISQSSDTIMMSSGRLIINSGNFQLDSNGNATLAGGVIQSSNYVANTSGTKIDLSNGVIDSKNFKLDGSGVVTAEGAILNSCQIRNGSVQISNSSESDRDNFMQLISEYLGTDNKFYSYRMNVSPFQITHQYTKYSGATPSTSVNTRDIIYVGNNGNITLMNSVGINGNPRVIMGTGSIEVKETTSYDKPYTKIYATGLYSYDSDSSTSMYSYVQGSNIGTTNLFATTAYIDTLSRTSGNIAVRTNLAFTSGTGINLGGQMAFQIYNNEVAVGASVLPIRVYATAAYTPTSWIVSSDERKKHSIELLDDRYLDIIKNIEPKRFKYINNPLDRYHTGYIAQDVQSAMQTLNVGVDELSAFVDVNGDGSDLALRYEEFIPLLHKWLRELESRLSALEKKGE